MVMIEDWIESHSDTIDIMEFSKTYRLTAPRVEQMLNKMVSMGYIELKG
jgi:DNA-binding IclR family transcriptional regulator